MTPHQVTWSAPRARTAKPLVLCLGNELIADDAVGPLLSERLRTSRQARNLDVIFTPRAGLALIDLLADRERVLVVDTIVSGQAPPGTLHAFPMTPAAPARHLTSSHQIGLPTALALGTRLGYRMPAHIDVLAVEAHDVVTLGAPLSPPVARALPKLMRAVGRWRRGVELSPSPVTARAPLR